MSMSDPIADMLTRIRNGQRANKVDVQFSASNKKSAILDVLKDEGYIAGYVTIEVEGKPVTTVSLKYFQGEPVINTLKELVVQVLEFLKVKKIYQMLCLD